MRGASASEQRQPASPQDLKEAPRKAGKGFQPPDISSIDDTGLTLGFLADLVLKVMYFEGDISGYDIAQIVKLPFAGVVEEALEFLRREQFCEVKGARGLGESSYRYTISDKGSEKAREVMERSMYVGPAPVPLQAYADSVHQQPLRNLNINLGTMRQMLSHLVLSQETFNQIGPAVNSGRSVFLFGPPGNGKTVIAESIGRMLMTDDMYIPYAFEVDGQVVKVFDQVNHKMLEKAPAAEKNTGVFSSGRQQDERWVKIKRPVISVGGELTLDALDLVFDEISKYYEAPFQIKANGGMFLIDDFGRQRMRPRDLLNRWIVPLEKRIDYLTLHTGRKIEVPFDMLIVFSTNLEPKELVEEAFLRRIRHKIEVGNPSYEQFREIFRRVCRAKNVPHDDRALAYLLQEHYIKKKRPLRACHPRDLLDELVDIANFTGVPVRLSTELLDKACEAYFVEL
ncbi:MAG: AAA family ATPase [Anaerolineaceae bacterium 4572_32.2]|nr:MAG: AAA family ATPase [Anaerolineaceae bacterium 4572_32.2]